MLRRQLLNFSCSAMAADCMLLLANDLDRSTGLHFSGYLLPVFQVVVNALLHSLPAVGNVLLLSCVVFLIFSVVAVNMFGGKKLSSLSTYFSLHACHVLSNQNQYASCTPVSLLTVSLFFLGKMFYCHEAEAPDSILNHSIIATRNQCLYSNLSWSQPFWVFDHVGHAYLHLFGVVSLYSSFLLQSSHVSLSHLFIR